MYEFKGLVANVATSSKINNENAGFVTPRNKNILPGNPLFSDKMKTALGDRKNTGFNTVTPLKNGSVFEKTKNNPTFQLATPNFQKTKISDVPFSTPQLPNTGHTKTTSIKQNIVDHTKNDVFEWNKRLMLNDEQFNLLFMEPNEIIAPPTPTPSPDPECPDLLNECKSPFWGDFDYKSNYVPNYCDDDDLPPLNMDFFDDFGSELLKENDANTLNIISSY